MLDSLYQFSEWFSKSDSVFFFKCHFELTDLNIVECFLPLHLLTWLMLRFIPSVPSGNCFTLVPMFWHSPTDPWLLFYYLMWQGVPASPCYISDARSGSHKKPWFLLVQNGISASQSRHRNSHCCRLVIVFRPFQWPNLRGSIQVFPIRIQNYRVFTESLLSYICNCFFTGEIIPFGEIRKSYNYSFALFDTLYMRQFQQNITCYC